MGEKLSERVATSVTPTRKREVEAIAFARSSPDDRVPVARVIREAVAEYVDDHPDEVERGLAQFEGAA